MKEQYFLTPKEKFGYTEEYIIVKYGNLEDNLLLNYSLSNNLYDIEIAIYSRTGQIIDLKNAHWKMNPFLSTSVKHLMKKHHVKYSVTTMGEKEIDQIVVNMCADDVWFITGFDKLSGAFYGWDKIETYDLLKDLINDMNNILLDYDDN
jgi:hypothetical protein